MTFPEDRLSRTTRSMGVSFIREMLKATKGVKGMISLAGGLPSPESFPSTTLGALFKEVVETDGADVLQYGATEGDDVLKRAINAYEGEPDVPLDRLIVTQGSTNAIYLFARSVLDPGDVVLCEGPSFSGSLVALEACGAELVPVPMDEEGLRVDRAREAIAAAKAAGKAVKFVYAIPDFQNPSGRTMSLARRRELIRTAREEGLFILEDEPYRELRFYGPRLASLWNLARAEFEDERTVVLCKSFSKILGPGLRLGFAVGPPEIVAAMARWSQKVITAPEGVVQRVVARFLERGYMADHLARIRDLYRGKRDVILRALTATMPAHMCWTEPEGGMFIWLTGPEGMDTDALFPKAAAAGVAYIPGSKFYPTGAETRNELRLNFSYASPDDLREGVARLARILA